MEQVIELRAGPIGYRDSGGTGPTIVFVHGVFANGTLWQQTVDALGSEYRCIRPDLPIGAHAHPMNPDADLSPRGVARLLGEFLDRLELTDVTLVSTDTGGAIAQLLLEDGHERVSRAVFTPCDSFDNFLPWSIRALQYLPKVPGLVRLGVQALRLPPARRIGFHWLSKRPLDSAMTGGWTHHLVRDARISRDLGKFLGGIDARDTLAAAEKLRAFDKPVLLLWPRTLPYFPFEHAQRWQGIFPDATLVEVPDSHTFVCVDQPLLLADEIARFAKR